jgi:hypothetical protein
MSLPSPWIALILAAASFRIWKLLAEDEILERPRRWIVRLDREWEEGLTLPDDYRLGLAKFITCPWCFGFWVTVVLWIIWQIEPHWTEILAVPFGFSAALGIISEKLDDEGAS